MTGPLTYGPADWAALRTLEIQVCQACVDRESGECHTPGCFYWLHSIEDVPTHLDVHVVSAERERAADMFAKVAETLGRHADAIHMALGLSIEAETSVVVAEIARLQQRLVAYDGGAPR